MNKKLLAVAISGAIAAPMAAQALDTKLSGQVNRMVRFADDGQGSDIQHIDNTASRSRFRFNTSGDMGNGITAGITYELGMGSNRSFVVPLKSGDTGDSFAGSSDIRHSALWFTGSFGKVTLGHTSEASDGAAYNDLSGTGLANEISAAEHGSSILVRTSGKGTAGVTQGGMRNTYDGGRVDLIRYDSPKFGPVSVKASVGNNERWALGANLNHSVGGGKLTAGAGYTDNNQGGIEMFTISGGFLFSQGTNINLAYGEGDRDGGGLAGRSSEMFYVKVGHRWGNNRISVDYGETTDHANKGVDGSNWGLGWLHNLAKPGVEIYAGYHHLDNEASAAGIANLGLAAGTSLEDADFFVVGSRIKFK